MDSPDIAFKGLKADKYRYPQPKKATQLFAHGDKSSNSRFHSQAKVGPQSVPRVLPFLMGSPFDLI